jgi:hypothetical protein
LHFSAKASISASTRINITTSASTSVMPSSTAPSLPPSQRYLQRLRWHIHQQCDAIFASTQTQA